MFFDDAELGGAKRRAALRTPPPIPPTGWTPPREFPRLDAAVCLGIDTETKDPNLLTTGPGWAKGQGHIVGVSVAAIDALGNTGKWYFPVRHEVDAHHNLSPEHVFAFCRDNFATPIPKVFANGIYDCGWLTEENIEVKGVLHDVQFAEALLVEVPETKLEFLGQKYAGEGKESSLLYQWSAGAYGGNVGPEQRANIYRCPPSLVGFYAESDADLPLKVLPKQWDLMTAEGLHAVYRMECDLIPLFVAMRRKGVAIDLQAAEQLYADLREDVKGLYVELSALTGVKVDSVSKPEQLAKVFDAVNVKYPRTPASASYPNGQPSFKKDWLNNLDHPIGDFINNIREHEKMRGTFIRSYILEGHVNGRVHGSFHPLRGEEGGARSGRIAASDPNLQNIPARTKLGKRVRRLYVPDRGKRHWRKFDYSQIEYRGLVHFAVGKGANEVRQQYRSDPTTDYHKLTQSLVKQHTGLFIDRKPIKNINFGLLYGMGLAKLARMLGVTKREAEKIMRAYHGGNPYIDATMQWAIKQAEEYGFVQTIMGRRSRFDMWEPRERTYTEIVRPLPYEQAVYEYGTNIKRSATHKAINRILQGSAADMMKQAMLAGWKSGVFDYLGVPPLTVHDELDFCDDGDKDDGFMYYQNVMENVMPLSIPIRVDMDLGRNWGDCDSEEDLIKDSPDDWRIPYYKEYNHKRSSLILTQ